MKLGILDYAPIDEGATTSEALRASTRLVQSAERLNYSRFWVSEHHGIEAMASVSPEVLIAHLASGHVVLFVAEVFVHFRFQSGLQDVLRQPVQQPVRTDEVDSLLPSLGQKLLR